MQDNYDLFKRPSEDSDKSDDQSKTKIFDKTIEELKNEIYRCFGRKCPIIYINTINFEIIDGIVKNVKFTSGCNGNTQGVAALAKGRPVEEVVALLKGIDCRGKGTSCPDQLARALEEAQRGA